PPACLVCATGVPARGTLPWEEETTMQKKQSMLRRSALAFAITIALSGVAGAKTFRIADQGDALSMDPHSLNESLQLSFTGNIYEPLVGRDKKLGLVPALATK